MQFLIFLVVAVLSLRTWPDRRAEYHVLSTRVLEYSVFVITVIIFIIENVKKMYELILSQKKMLDKKCIGCIGTRCMTYIVWVYVFFYIFLLWHVPFRPPIERVWHIQHRICLFSTFSGRMACRRPTLTFGRLHLLFKGSHLYLRNFAFFGV